MPAPAGDSDDVVSVMPRVSKKWTSSDSSRSSRRSRSSRQSVRFDGDAGVFGADDDAVVRTRLDACPSTQADRGVERLGAGMKEVERPDVDRAAREIDSRGR